MFIPDITKRKLKNVPTNEVGIFVKMWNIKYPLDRWYREKHKIAWSSDKHRKLTLLSILFEFEEDKAYREVLEKFSKEKVTESKYEPGNWYISESDDIEVDDAENLYDNIDINDIQEDEEGNIILSDK